MREYEEGRVSGGSPAQEFDGHLGKRGLWYIFVISNPSFFSSFFLLIMFSIFQRRLLIQLIQYGHSLPGGRRLVSEERGRGAVGTTAWERI